MATGLKRISNLPSLLLVGLIANILLILAGTKGPGTPMGDLDFAYQPWADQFMQLGTLFGISSAWVYPYPALIPIILANLATPGHLGVAWLIGRTVLMLGILTALVLYKTDEQERPRRYVAAYAWIGLTLALGPVSISRVDSMSVLIAILGALALATGSRLGAAIFFTVAAWVKIWPVALFVAISTSRKSWFKVVAYGAAISVGFLVVAFLLGANMNVFSFITGQGERGLQIEAPMATPWLWAAVLGQPTPASITTMRF